MVAYHKTFTEKLLAVRPEKVTRRKERKKIRKVIAKLFALNANAKIKFLVKCYCFNRYNLSVV